MTRNEFVDAWNGAALYMKPSKLRSAILVALGNAMINGLDTADEDKTVRPWSIAFGSISYDCMSTTKTNERARAWLAERGITY